VSIGVYVVDFYCAEVRLAVEVDGDSHFMEGAVAYDTTRQAAIEALNVQFLRFTNDQVKSETDAVVEVIWRTVTQTREAGKDTPPLPSPESGEGGSPTGCTDSNTE
jgi:very-short-patch-repair endonuclease